MNENESKYLEATPRQIIMGGVTGLIWVDLKNPVTDSHSCHSCHCLSPCHSCPWRKCDGIFYSKTMQHYRSVVVFDPCICFWKFSLNFHFPLLLHHFYSHLHRIQAEISSFYSWTKLFHEWTFFVVILPETVDSYNDLLIAFWRHSHLLHDHFISTLTFICNNILYRFIEFFIFSFTKTIYAWQFLRESQSIMCYKKSTPLVTATVASLLAESLLDKEEKAFY